MTLAILSALSEEQRGLLDQLERPECAVHAGRHFWCGVLHGHRVVLALSGMGKVAAATTATLLIERFAVEKMVFTGVAGGLGSGVNVGDLVVARDFLQHDMNVSPLFPRFEVPSYGRSRFAADLSLAKQLCAASQTALVSLAAVGSWPHATAVVHHGLLASGDLFVCSVHDSQRLQTDLAAAGHEALAVEMEGAAVAQVCHDYGVPFAAVRTISDRADQHAPQDFPAFARDVAGVYAQAIFQAFLTLSQPLPA